jgi:hypothetical protein
MKNQMFALIGLGLLLATASAYAQTGVVKANVPFNFIVNKTQLPAGEYKILPLGITGSALSIQSPDGKVIKEFLPNACTTSETPKTSKLVFHRCGAQYFLAEIWGQETTGARNCRRVGSKPRFPGSIRLRVL